MYRRVMSRSSDVLTEVAKGLADSEHGWWVAAVLDAFGFLEQDFGYELASVFLHFRGTSLTYTRPENELSLTHDPEDTGRVFGSFTRRPLPADVDRSPEWLTVNRLLRSRDPSLVLPDPTRTHLDRAAVLDALTVWSHGLRDLAPDVLRGDWPDLPTTS